MKQLFGPMPLRAMALDLSGLDMKVLLCVAAHDRMSLVAGKGQGCRASNERMSIMVGCSYAGLCRSLSKLVALHLLTREPAGKDGRQTIYRVLYTDEDMLLFGNISRPAMGAEMTTQPPQIGCQTDSETAEIGCRDDLSSGGKPPEMPSQYIPLNGGNTFCETGEYNSSEEARLAARVLPKMGIAENVGGQLARLERALSVGQVIDRFAWLQYLEDACCDENANNSARAVRLSETVIEGMNEDEYARWGLTHGWVDDDGNWHCPQEVAA